MNIKLIKLQIENFKGIRQFVSGDWNNSVNVYGDNATGKTTLHDAFQWLLFDKNSDGNSKFGIKPLDQNGEERHNLETVVTAILNVDGVDTEFKKTFKEKWTRKRGSEETEFSGHTTDYEIDNVPLKLSDYKSRVNDLVNEDIFKMLTNVMHFNEIDWKKRREIVMSLSPDITDLDVAATNPELDPLIQELKNNKSIEAIQATAKASRQKANEQLKVIPGRIDELEKIDYSSVAEAKPDELQKLINENEAKLQEIAVKKANIGNGQELLNLELEIRKLQVERAELVSFKSDKAEKLERVRTEGTNLKMQLQTEQMAIRDLEAKINRIKTDLSYNENMREKLYADYDLEAEKQFTADTCSYCHQTLPENKVEELKKGFNSHKTTLLESIVEQGKEVAKKIALLGGELDKAISELEYAKDVEKKLNEDIKAKLFEYNQVQSIVEENPNQGKINEITSQMENFNAKLNNLKTSFVANPYEDEEQTLRDAIVKANRSLIMLEQKATNDKRIEDLTTEMKDNSKALSAAEQMLTLCDKFTVTKVGLLENKINNHFDLVNFKLFDVQINGGIVENCVATVNGVPFGDLNNAMKINAGLDIIKGLQQVYNTKAPIFIDNAESVTRYIDLPDTQIIKMYVSEEDKELRFEY